MRKLKVLVACEYSGAVRRAFRTLGHNAWSMDLLPAEDESEWHIEGDIKDPTSTKGALDPIFSWSWDLMIAFPPCTDLCVSGARWFKQKRADGSQQRSIDFFMMLVNAPVEHIAIENPIGIMSNLYRKPSQIIQPWQFGHGETKATCLWLKGLPLLVPTDIVSGREQRVHLMPPGPNRWKERSRTYPGIAQAMATQWSDYLINKQ